LKKVLHSGSSALTFVLPYRTITGSFNWSNPSLDNKLIQGSVTADDKVYYSFRLLLPYKLLGWYISDPQMASLCDSINKKRNVRTSAVQNAKGVADRASGSYITNKPLVDAANANVGNAAGLKAAAEKQKNTASSHNQNCYCYCRYFESSNYIFRVTTC